jgi:nitrite reductase (NO-forming)
MYTLNGHKAALADPSIYGEAIRVMRGIEPAGGRGEIGGKVRFFFVTGGPNIGSNWHIIGTIFDQVYTGHPSTPIRNEETVYVAPGSAAVFELTALVPGKYLLVDHALFRVPKGATGFLWVDPQCHDVNTCAWPKDIFSPPTTGTGH